MAGKTAKPYKATLSGSIGAGMGSVFNPRGRKYYILEHRVSSKYHRAGEAQEIIVDQIEIGRDSRCQVRFDDNFSTVSRRHAAIIKDGDNWKLVQISKTNTTLLNGRPVQNEWYLQNGDEIQLSVNGPKLGFIVPTGKKATVGSIGLTRRLSLFRQQALRPYKQAIAALATILVLAIGGLGTWNYFLRNDLISQSKTLAEQIKLAKNNKEKADSLAKQLYESNQRIAGYEEKLQKVGKQSSAAYRKASSIHVSSSDFKGKGSADIEKCFPNVYYIKVFMLNGDKPIASWSGTGFLLDNGYFVTAHHCTTYGEVTMVKNPNFNPNEKADENNPRYIVDPEGEETQINLYWNNYDLRVVMLCFSSTDKFKLEYTTQKTIFKSGNSPYSRGIIPDGDHNWNIVKYNFSNDTDWSYVKVNKSGGLPYDAAISKNLPAKTPLDILGFPLTRGAEDVDNISPIYSTSTVARSGLDVNGTIMLSNEDTQGGNSGGPVLINKDGKYIVVGILSGSTAGKDRVCPIGSVFK